MDGQYVGQGYCAQGWEATNVVCRGKTYECENRTRHLIQITDSTADSLKIAFG